MQISLHTLISFLWNSQTGDYFYSVNKLLFASIMNAKLLGIEGAPQLAIGGGRRGVHIWSETWQCSYSFIGHDYKIKSHRVIPEQAEQTCQKWAIELLWIHGYNRIRGNKIDDLVVCVRCSRLWDPNNLWEYRILRLRNTSYSGRRKVRTKHWRKLKDVDKPRSL